MGVILSVCLSVLLPVHTAFSHRGENSSSAQRIPPLKAVNVHESDEVYQSEDQHEALGSAFRLFSQQLSGPAVPTLRSAAAGLRAAKSPSRAPISSGEDEAAADSVIQAAFEDQEVPVVELPARSCQLPNVSRRPWKVKMDDLRPVTSS
ncbi:uncharacterized protein V6R79_022368 [Siganus canaliculatus]